MRGVPRRASISSRAAIRFRVRSQDVRAENTSGPARYPRRAGRRSPSEPGLEHRLDHPADQLAADLLPAVVHRVLRRPGKVRRPAAGSGADDHLDLALLDLKEPPAVLAEEVVEATGVEELLEVTPGIAHQRQIDDVAHLS